MTISKDTGKKMVKIGLFIVTPTVILILILLFLYWRKKKKKSLLEKSGDLDTTDMDKYRISVPFKYQPKLFIDGKFYDAISKINYSHLGDNVENDMILVDVLMKPEDLSKMKEMLDDLNSEVSIQKM